MTLHCYPLQMLNKMLLAGMKLVHLLISNISDPLCLRSTEKVIKPHFNIRDVFTLLQQ